MWKPNDDVPKRSSSENSLGAYVPNIIPNRGGEGEPNRSFLYYSTYGNCALHNQSNCSCNVKDVGDTNLHIFVPQNTQVVGEQLASDFHHSYYRTTFAPEEKNTNIPLHISSSSDSIPNHSYYNNNYSPQHNNNNSGGSGGSTPNSPRSSDIQNLQRELDIIEYIKNSKEVDFIAFHC